MITREQMERWMWLLEWDERRNQSTRQAEQILREMGEVWLQTIRDEADEKRSSA